MSLRKRLKQAKAALRRTAHSVITGVLIATVALFPHRIGAQIADSNGYIVIDIPIARSGHSFTIDNGTSVNESLSTGAYGQVGTNVSYIPGWDDPSMNWWMYDWTANEYLELPQDANGYASVVGAQWSSTSGLTSAQLFVLVSDSCWRYYDQFALSQGNGTIVLPKWTGQVTLNDGTGYSEYAFDYDPAFSYRLLDLTTGEAASLNADVIDSSDTWEPIAQLGEPVLITKVIYFPASSAGYHFTLTSWRAEDPSTQMLRRVIPGFDAPDPLGWPGYARAEVVLPYSAEWTLFRDVDNEGYYGGPATDWYPEDWTWVFPDRPKQMVSFWAYTGVSHHEYFARQPHASFQVFLDSTNSPNGTELFWNEYTLDYDYFSYHVGEVEVDAGMAFHFEDVTDNIALAEGDTIFWGGFTWNQPPSDSITLDVNAVRAANEVLSLTGPDGQYAAVTGEVFSDWNYSVWEDSPVWYYEVPYIRFQMESVAQSGQGSWSGEFTLMDWMTFESWVLTPGYHDLKHLWPQPLFTQFQISETRWNHDLRIRQPHTTAEAAINQIGSAGYFMDEWQQTYYYFDADGYVTDGPGFWIYDATTGESAPLNQTNLINWIHVAPPTLQSPTATTQFNSYDGHVPLQVIAGSDNVAEYSIERKRSDGEWQEVSRVPRQPGYLTEYWTDTGIYRSGTYLYRARAHFSNASSAPSQEFTAEVTLTDTDGDGMSDKFEDAWNLNAGDPGDADAMIYGAGMTAAQMAAANTAPASGGTGTPPSTAWTTIPDTGESDTVRSKTYAVINVRDFLPNEPEEFIRTNFVGKAITIDMHTSQIGFAGSMSVNNVDKILTYTLSDGTLHPVNSFKPFRQDPDPAVAGDVGDYGYTTSCSLSYGGCWVGPTGLLEGNATHTRMVISAVENGEIHGDPETFIAPIGGGSYLLPPSAFWPDPASVPDSAETLDVSQDGKQVLGQSSDGTWTLNHVPIPALAPSLGESFWCRDINDAGMFIVERRTGGSPVETFVYSPDDHLLHPAPYGLAAVNSQGQGIGLENYNLEDTGAYFWPGISAGITKIPIKNLLIRRTKPPGTRDDHELYFAPGPTLKNPLGKPIVRKIRPALLSDADPETSGIMIDGRIYPLGIPKRILLRAEVMAADGQWHDEDVNIETARSPNTLAPTHYTMSKAKYPDSNHPGFHTAIDMRGGGVAYRISIPDELQYIVPLEVVAHKRGTVFVPGELVPAGTGEFGYETVMMENGDSESADDSTVRDCNLNGNLSAYRKANDDDLVKVVLKFQANLKIPGASLKLLHEGMQVDATKSTPETAVTASGASRLKFFKADGTLITNPDTDLQIPDLANPPGDRYLSKIVTDGEVTIFVEGADKFGDLPIDKAARLGGAILKWEFQQGGATATAKLLVYRGGFLRFVQPANRPGTVGKFEFWDGKGRVKHEWVGHGREFRKDDTDMGTKLASWDAKSGKPAPYGSDYNVNKGNGHAPPGWYRQAPGGPLTGTQRDDTKGSGDTLKIKQGSYRRWKQDDETDPAKQYTTRYRYDASKQKDREIGAPVGIGFKYNMVPITANDPQPLLSGVEPAVKRIPEAQNRNALQIHPDGECTDSRMGGTAGCIGIQTYKDCYEVDDVLKRYHSLKVKVIIGNP